jgi:hypothetical protein|tara:strand:- start:2082 stop:2324 length:243 start_codon:yes stop_codon:yes gene_type:complete
MECSQGSGMTVTAKAAHEIDKQEACHCGNFFHHLEEVEENLLEAVKIGRFTYGKQVNRKMLLAELEALLDSAILQYGKEI